MSQRLLKDGEEILKESTKLIMIYMCVYIQASQVALVVKNPPTNEEDIRDMGLIPGSERFPGEDSLEI